MLGLDAAHFDVFARRHFVAHEVLKDDSDLGMQVGEIVLPQVHSIQQNPAFGGVVKPRDQFHDCGFSLAVLANQRHPLAGLQREIKTVKNAPAGARIRKRDILKLEPAQNRPPRAHAAGLRLHRRFHGEKRQQVCEEQRLVRDSRGRRKCLLNVAHRLHDGGSDQRKGADGVDAAKVW